MTTPRRGVEGKRVTVYVASSIIILSLHSARLLLTWIWIPTEVFPSPERTSKERDLHAASRS